MFVGRKKQSGHIEVEGIPVLKLSAAFQTYEELNWKETLHVFKTSFEYVHAFQVEKIEEQVEERESELKSWLWQPWRSVRSFWEAVLFVVCPLWTAWTIWKEWEDVKRIKEGLLSADTLKEERLNELEYQIQRFQEAVDEYKRLYEKQGYRPEQASFRSGMVTTYE